LSIDLYNPESFLNITRTEAAKPPRHLTDNHSAEQPRDRTEKVQVITQMVHMNTNVAIVLADDDEGHARLIRKNLRRGNMNYPIIHLKDGEETLNFFFKEGTGLHREEGMHYILLLDISMPKVNGMEVLKTLKENHTLRDTPVIMVTTTDNPKEINTCKSLGCLDYITKFTDYAKFAQSIRELGTKLNTIDIPIAS
jgi:CheY-like chemotaxis protein